jgi:hypothetical protein
MEATGNLKLSGMRYSVLPFVVSNPTPALEDAFTARKAEEGDASMLLFHGTKLYNLRSILRDRFRPSREMNCVWVAEEHATFIHLYV